MTPSPSAARLPPPPFLANVVPREAAAQRVAQLLRPLVFTNGVFDLMHSGHATYLAQARELGASLVVAINTDASARRLGKGSDRPINAQADRACMLAALAAVDLVTFFDEDTPLELVRQLQPDVLVKGGDYDMDRLAEAALVRSWGGRALAIELVHGYSTTALLARIRSASA